MYLIFFTSDGLINQSRKFTVTKQDEEVVGHSHKLTAVLSIGECKNAKNLLGMKYQGVVGVIAFNMQLQLLLLLH